jgi:uncharacterized protein
MTKFIGRKEELATLETLLAKNTASLIVVKGRRRIGKSRLLDKFSQSFQQNYIFSGLPPTKTIELQSQQQEFISQYERYFGSKPKKTKDWSDLLWQLAMQTSKGRVLVVLDEITWMGSKDPDFLGKLKNAWDLYFKKNDRLVLALCGSISSWIEKNILSSTGFLGRESLVLTLNEMPLSDCIEFWGKEKSRTSIGEKLKILAISGGIPRYLESINPSLSSKENIQNLCFKSSGILFNEFEKIFSDLFLSRNKIYKEIVNCLVNGVTDQATIMRQVDLKSGGVFSDYLDDLVEAGFISRDYTWQLKDGAISRLSHYRLKDNYSRFYLKYILPNRAKVTQGNIRGLSLSALQGWQVIMGLQVENLILSNRELIKSALGLSPNEIICDNPFFQRKTARQKGCQVDYLIQTNSNLLYICEIKYSINPVGSGVIEAVKEKINRMSIPRYFSLRPVLIHVNGVGEAVLDSQYFSHVINFGDFLKFKCEEDQ